MTADGRIDLGDQRLECRIIGPDPASAPTLVMLHEGLGSVALWGDFPSRLAEATGCGVFTYSRAGYGRSTTCGLPRPLSYLHDEAQAVLPRVLDAIGFRQGVLVGHSDGASIAAIFLGEVADARVLGASLIAPHFIVEDMTIEGISETRRRYEEGDLKPRLSRWHDDVEAAFRGWNDAWLHPAFRSWDISDSVSRIGVPLQIVQGEDDAYGSIRQIEIAQRACPAGVEVVLMPGIGHVPHREAPQATVDAVASYCRQLLRA